MRDVNNRNAVAIRVIARPILLIYSYFIHSYRSRRVRAMKMHRFLLFSPPSPSLPLSLSLSLSRYFRREITGTGVFLWFLFSSRKPPSSVYRLSNKVRVRERPPLSGTTGTREVKLKNNAIYITVKPLIVLEL